MSRHQRSTGPTSVRRSRSTTTSPTSITSRLAHEPLVQLQLAALALEPRLILQLHAAVVVDLLDDDRERLAARRARDPDDAVLLAHDRRPGHVVDRLRAGSRVDADGAVVLEEEDAVARRETRGRAARRTRSSSGRRGSARSLEGRRSGLFSSLRACSRPAP